MPRPAGKARVSTRAKLIIALAVIMAMIGMLVYTAVTHAATYYVTVRELAAQGSGAIGQPLTVSGQIGGSPVKWDPARSLLMFSIQDKAGEKPLPVVFHGPKPDDFGNNWPVIVSGELTSKGVFEATQLLIKCPSKYKVQQRTYHATA